MFDSLVKFIRAQYGGAESVSLHTPIFRGNERKYVLDTIDSTFVSSVGAYVDKFEHEIARYTGSPGAVATVNGTAALHVALKLAGVQNGDLVITQPLTFVATCNAISYCGADPIFVDVDRHTLGLSPVALELWLDENARLDSQGICVNREDGRLIKACVPMHTFGHPVDLDNLVDVCARWKLFLVEDAAESLGSLYKGKHTGTFGKSGALSFNGNKIITTGGGGMVLGDEIVASKAKHLTTTAKVPHLYAYDHDEIGYNYRMPNINAALGCAQLERLESFVSEKRALADRYAEFFFMQGLDFFREPTGCRSNYWLNTVICESKSQRDFLVEHTNRRGIMTRPVWTLMNHLVMYHHCRKGSLKNAEWLSDRLVNLPSGVLYSLSPGAALDAS